MCIHTNMNTHMVTHINENIPFGTILLNQSHRLSTTASSDRHEKPYFELLIKGVQGSPK